MSFAKLYDQYSRRYIITWRKSSILPSMLIGRVCVCVCLFVCMLVCGHATGQGFTNRNIKFSQHIARRFCRAPWFFGQNRLKVEVKVTKKVKNTLFTITLERNVVERSALAQNVQSEFSRRSTISASRSRQNKVKPHTCKYNQFW